jgi:hypothetical protein
MPDATQEGQLEEGHLLQHQDAQEGRPANKASGSDRPKQSEGEEEEEVILVLTSASPQVSAFFENERAVRPRASRRDCV